MKIIENTGWIKLHRNLLDEPIWKQSKHEYKVVFITLLLLANHKPNKWIFEGQKYTSERGQLITSIKSLSEKSSVSMQSVRGSLAKFERLGFITNKSTNQNRLITIVNFDKYQGLINNTNNQINKQPTSNQQATNKQPTTNKNDKNNKNIASPGEKNESEEIMLEQYKMVLDGNN